MSELIVRPFVDSILGNSSYLVALPKAGIAAVIDPQREVEPYLKVARELNVHIAYALETHLHADFISGTRELQARVLAKYPNTQFTIGASAGAELGFEHVALQDRDTLVLGHWNLRVIETPGHTPEHISFLVSQGDKPHSVFSGGSLLVGGAGRTDHLGDELKIPLAHHLYHSLHERLLSLPDDVIVYPTHGAGSFCNATVSDRRVTTIGNEVWNNPFALASDEQEFVQLCFQGLGGFPTYFHKLRDVNRRGARILGERTELEELTPLQAQTAVMRGAAILDIRSPRAFAAGHLAGSYGIPFVSPLTRWAGWVVPFGTPLVLISDNPVELADAVRQLLNIGYEDFVGAMNGVEDWEATGLPVARAEIVPQPRLQQWLDASDKPYLVDVRFDDEYRAGHLPGAHQIELGAWHPAITHALPREQPIVMYCRSGNRATVGYSLLEQHGFRNVKMLESGYADWKAHGFATTDEKI